MLQAASQEAILPVLAAQDCLEQMMEQVQAQPQHELQVFSIRCP